MTLAPGVRLGPYEILSPLGAGGMGEVYKARDTRLGREVAIKVLSSAVATDSEHLRRFEQEARSASALSDPHIVTVFDVGEQDGIHYFASELVEGGDLRSRLGADGIPVRKAIEIAEQIASGLASAHEKGITHRDLKPENILITKAGQAKIADFGLAKLAETPDAELSQMPTANRIETTEGVVMGTVSYMSPEQAAGRKIDYRSDQFSFGLILYEMLTGKLAFRKETRGETLAAILRDEPPPISELNPSVPFPVVWIVERCLAKDPEERYASTRDLAREISGVRRHISGATSSGREQAVASPRKNRIRIVWAIAGAIGAGIIVFPLSYRTAVRVERKRLEKVSFVQETFRRQAIFQAAFAPDGETIVYSAAQEGNVPELFTIRSEFPEPRPLGLPRTHLLSISAKGELAVLTNARYVAQRLFTGTLARVSLGGTAPREILENVRQADWSPDGTELAIIRTKEGKDRLEFPIGKVLYETAGYLSDLRVSPRGDRIALFEHPRKWDDRGSVIIVDRAGKRTLLSGEYGGGVEGLAWSKTGDEVIFAGDIGSPAYTLYSVDLSGHRRVALRSAGGLTMHDVSRTGRWLVTRDDAHYEISVRGPGATAERDLSWLDQSVGPYLSRDGSLLLFDDQSAPSGPNYGLCLRRTDGGPVVRLGEGRDWGLSPDENWALAIIFTPPQLVIYPTGPGEIRRLPRGNLQTYQTAAWFPDGKRVLVVGNEAGKASRCYAQDVSGGPPRPVTPEATMNGTVSPDGLQILYLNSLGNWFIQRAGGGTAEAVSELTSEDEVIRWSADGRSIYVFRPSSMPLRIERLDLASGRRVLVREVSPADRTGVVDGQEAALTDDTRSYAYTYRRMTSQLFVVQGAQ
jgi:serine/threonine protein kinase/Tol biopolymer transport system component